MDCPRPGKTKMNFDASFLQDSKSASMGMVIRDHNANVICSSAQWLPCCDDAEEAEARALLVGLQTCLQVGIWSSEVETDCAAVFSAVNAPDKNLSKLCFISREINRIKEAGPLFSLSLAKRECNQVAHELAKCNRIEGTDGFWFDSVPNRISPYVTDDCNKLMLN